jgi:penicillin-binding protein 1A
MFKEAMAKAFLVGALALLLAPLAAAAFVGWGWWTYKRSEKSIVEKMDQYYLTVTSPGHERYLLESDETFEIPYMASKLSVDAVPTRILDAQDRLIGEFSVEKGLYVRDTEDLPIFLKRALVASEDGNFYTHHGINWMATTRAILTCIKNLRFSQGGSTITQQLAKMMFTTRKKTPGRKVFEMFCASKLERKFTKDQILLMYLNFAYFGHGAFGVEAASRYYFGKTTKELELAEAAMLVGIIPNPTRYSPYENLELSQARHRTTLTRMAKLGFIPQSAINRYSEEFWEKMARRGRAPSVSFWKMTVNEAPYLVEYVRRALLKDFSKERLLKGGLRIHTTFDLELQKAGVAALQASLSEENKPAPKSAKAEAAEAPEPDAAPIEGALAAVRPTDGAMLALVGGSGFDFQNQLIRAESRRPIGSCVKPFVWAAALENGKFKPGDKILDAPVTFTIGPNAKKWQPKNYGDKYFGEVTFEFALHKSLNAPAIKILKDVGVKPVIELLSRATGIGETGFPRNLSLALGTADGSVLDLARAYSLFVNGGRPVQPYYIRYIEDREGTVLRDERARPEPEAPVLKAETVAAMLEIMRGVLGPEGTGHGAALRTGFNIPAAAKSGTTNDYRDAWFAGATPDVAAAVWMGHDDMRHSLGKGKAGGAIAAPAWMGFIKAAYRNRPTRPLDVLLPAPVVSSEAGS